MLNTTIRAESEIAVSSQRFDDTRILNRFGIYEKLIRVALEDWQQKNLLPEILAGGVRLSYRDLISLSVEVVRSPLLGLQFTSLTSPSLAEDRSHAVTRIRPIAPVYSV